MVDGQKAYMSGMKLEIFDDKPPVLVNKYAQSKTIGAAYKPQGVVSRSNYYTSKKTTEAINTQTAAKKPVKKVQKLCK